jgi:hypothetical protein
MISVSQLRLFFSILGIKSGAPGRIRTRDPLITNQVLYQLSYKGSGDADSSNRIRKQEGKARYAGRVWPQSPLNARRENPCACRSR